MEGVSRAGQRASSLLAGVMEVRTGPPRLMSTLRTYYHPVTQKTVVLHPLPNMASPQYFRRVLSPQSLLKSRDEGSTSFAHDSAHPPPPTASRTSHQHSPYDATPSEDGPSSRGDTKGSESVPHTTHPFTSFPHDEAVVFDKILCEDGLLPLPLDSAKANGQRVLQWCFPFLRLRPVVARSTGEQYYDGILQRDQVESRMTFEMLRDQWNPPVDPRARRAVDRILHSYSNHTCVCVPWSPYHIPYFIYRLELEGFELVKKEEVEVMGFRFLVYGIITSVMISFYLLVKALMYVLGW